MCIRDSSRPNQVRKNIYDIGNYCQNNSVQSFTNETKIFLLENVWKPQPGYKFPSITNSNHTRSFQMKWLNLFMKLYVDMVALKYKLTIMVASL